MLKALIRLIAITIGSLIVTFLAVVLVRWMGLQQRFREPPHPWYQQTEWHILKPSPADLCSQDADQIVPAPNWIVSLPVERKGEDWFVACPGGKLLKEYLSAQSHRDWLIHIHAHDTWSLDKLSEILHAFDNHMRFGILTDSQKVAIFMRKQGPEWLFAADSAALLRFRLFESLWIDTAMDFWPDFVVTDFAKADELDARGAEELLRRKKRLIWDRPDGMTTPPQIAIQGTMTTRPE